MTLVVSLIVVLFGSLVFMSHRNGRAAGDTALRKACDQMLADQKQKIQVASHAMAVTIGEMLKDVQGREERAECVRRMVRDIRFEADDSGYFYVYDGTINVALPTKPSLHGQDLKDLTDPDGIRLVPELRDQANAGGGFVMYKWAKGDEKAVPKIGYAELIPGTSMWIGTGVYLDNIERMQQSIGDKILKAVNQNTLSMLAVCSVIFLLIVTVCVTVAVGIVRSIRRITRQLEDVAEGNGDLTQRIEIDSNDEIGELAKWFNVFVDKLQTMVASICQNLGKLDTEVHDLSSLAVDLSGNVSDTSERTDQVSSAVGQMTDSLSSVAAAMQESNTNVAMVASASEEMTATVQSIAGSTLEASKISSEAVGQAGAIRQRMAELGECTEAIGAVTEVITEISEQINLLALNATIEAARSGEAGKGFAVVANEIKHLAKQTADATLDIETKIGDVQRNTNVAVDEIESIATIVQSVNGIVETISTAVGEQSKAADEIASSVGHASQGLNTINRSADEVSCSASKIRDQICSVSVATQEASSFGQRVDVSSNDLKGFSEELMASVSSFKV